MTFNGHEYRMVKEFEDGISYGYRDLGEERIEIIQSFMGESWVIGPLSIRIVQEVLGYREFDQQVEEQEQQLIFNWELRQGIENPLRPPASA